MTVRRTREQVDYAIKSATGGETRYVGGGAYDPWEVTMPDRRVWNVVGDGSLTNVPQRRRLKLFARASVVDAENDPGLAERLTIPGYRGRVERCVTAKIVAFDWNCPQHITPRWSEEEWALRGGR